MQKTESQNFYFSTTGAQCARDGIILCAIFFAMNAVIAANFIFFDDLVVFGVDPVVAVIGLIQAVVIGAILWRYISLYRCEGKYEIASDGETLAISSPSELMGPSAMIRLSEIRCVEIVGSKERSRTFCCRISTDSETTETIRLHCGFDMRAFVRHLARYAPHGVLDKDCQQWTAID